MNVSYFIGRLTADPDIRYTQDGKPIARFRVAVNRNFHKEGEAEADFFNVTAFGKTAERFEKLNVQKGTKLLLTCELRNNNYTDKDGVKKYENQIIVINFEFCERKQDQVATSADSDNFESIPDGITDEEFPFK